MENENDLNDDFYIFYYENVFNIVSNIINTYPEDQTKQKLIIKILIKILKNILESITEEININNINNNKNNSISEKFRKLKLSNSNIQLIFTVEGIYDFFILLGFYEKYFDNELYLFFLNVQLHHLVLSLKNYNPYI